MAEAVVGVLISKLGEALLSEAAAYGASLFCREASALKGLFSEIRRATGWLEIMKAYLQDSEKFRDTSNTTDAFVKKIRGLAFRIEDVADEFKYKLEDGKHGGFAAKMNKRIRHVKVWHRLTYELRDINADLEDAAKQANLCAMPIIERTGAGNYYHAGSINPTSCFARDEDLVGIEDNAEKLKGWLLDMEEKKSRIVAIWGMGGAGKTTLVGHVYKSVKEDFDFAAWVTVSKSWQVQDLLNKIATGLGISGDINKMETRSLALSELRTFAISNVKNEHSVNLCSAIMNMSHLINLSITASNEDEVLQMEALRLPATLSKLSLVGQLEKKQIPQILLSWSHLMSLTRLSLAFTKLDDDSFSSLRALRGLCRLELSKAYDGTTLCFPTKSFPRLRFLGIMGAAQLNHVDIEEGALESLVDLMFIQCPELKHLPHGIEYLAALKELRLEDTATQLIEKLRKKHEADEEFMKISHIRKVFVMLTEKNIWERVR
ncbi:hypothetical protein QOZ80_9BG0693610 [Eleusine coracana subsp. coracana]|nr:hypothetical protein QOZ80_9BG0693610 [Eleusine coracana subsp. coracana]